MLRLSVIYLSIYLKLTARGTLIQTNIHRWGTSIYTYIRSYISEKQAYLNSFTIFLGISIFISANWEVIYFLFLRLFIKHVYQICTHLSTIPKYCKLKYLVWQRLNLLIRGFKRLLRGKPKQWMALKDNEYEGGSLRRAQIPNI